ncbi:uncharacterized protein LOC125041113 [Penaeus chinensis]|uniref:uncharacterized protein LOC125041113 n=1 Tax=Penaeus chinensis TaxID=139456 RepID=UPI001FB643F4|nr:uncharacterized protein LOC125041113 [Penaeus chinensis]
MARDLRNHSVITCCDSRSALQAIKSLTPSHPVSNIRVLDKLIHEGNTITTYAWGKSTFRRSLILKECGNKILRFRRENLYLNTAFPMKILLAFLLTAAILSVILMSQSTIELYSKLTRPEAETLSQPSPVTKAVKDPTFMETCYTYDNFTANNICCKLRKYSGSDIYKCTRELFTKQILQNRQAANTTSKTSSVNDLGRIHIALVGDSHMRDLFVAMAQRVEGEELLYTFDSQNVTWQSIGSLFYQMRARNRIFESVRVRHLGFPLQVSWYKDVELKKFVTLIKKWETGEEPKPSFVITGFGLHWMKNFPKPIGVHYKNFFTKLVPHLSRLATTVPVYFKLVDYVLRAYFEKRLYPGINLEAIPAYNIIAREQLQGTGVTLWDSTVPLSIAYVHECLREKRITPVVFTWKCQDDCHLGYVMLEQYADMVYNAACNRFLGLGDEYCNVNG